MIAILKDLIMYKSNLQKLLKLANATKPKSPN
jgi:hypothetical protein